MPVGDPNTSSNAIILSLVEEAVETGRMDEEGTTAAGVAATGSGVEMGSRP